MEQHTWNFIEKEWNYNMEMVSIFANLIRMPFAYIRIVVCDNFVELFLARSRACSEQSGYE